MKKSSAKKLNYVERFSSRVENYVKYRPSYPQAIIGFMTAELSLIPTSIVADMGAGTGKLTELFLDNGNVVYAVEPNEDMMAAAQSLLSNRPNFYPIAATAQLTTLPNECADFIVVGQAFHWFDQDKAKVEFQRLLKPDGVVLLIWNEWQQSSPFLQAYQGVVDQFSVDYGAVNRKRVTGESKEAVLQRFLGNFLTRTFENVQLFDFEGVKGRLLSSSYAPLSDHPNHEPMLAALRVAFDTFADNGRTPFTYDCHVHYGQLD